MLKIEIHFFFMIMWCCNFKGYRLKKIFSFSLTCRDSLIIVNVVQLSEQRREVCMSEALTGTQYINIPFSFVGTHFSALVNIVY